MATEMSRRIGQRIRQRRDELGLTQKQVAQRMPSDAVDAQRVSDWERGWNKPSERYLQELVQALEVPDVSYFYETSERPTPEPFSGGIEHDDVAAGDGRLEALTAAIAGIDERLGRIEDNLAKLVEGFGARPIEKEIIAAIEQGLTQQAREVRRPPPQTRWRSRLRQLRQAPHEKAREHARALSKHPLGGQAFNWPLCVDDP